MVSQNLYQVGLLLASCLSLTALGCASDIVDDAAGTAGHPGESVSTTQEDASLNCWPKNYDVNGSATGPSTASNICYVTVYESSPTPYEPYFQIFQSSGTWYAGGYGRMSCVPQACFHANGAYQRWLSSDFAATASVAAGRGSKYVTTPMWLGDAMPILTGILRYSTGPMGQYEGANTYFYGPTHTSDLTAGAYSYSGQPSSSISAYGYSFFVGVPHTGHVVQMASYWVNSSTPTQQMINTSDGICALSSLNTMNDANNDYALITNQTIDSYGTQAWFLAIPGAGHHPTTANADCFYFNQQ